MANIKWTKEPRNRGERGGSGPHAQDSGLSKPRGALGGFSTQQRYHEDTENSQGTETVVQGALSLRAFRRLQNAFNQFEDGQGVSRGHRRKAPKPTSVAMAMRPSCRGGGRALLSHPSRFFSCAQDYMKCAVLTRFECISGALSKFMLSYKGDTIHLHNVLNFPN